MASHIRQISGWVHGARADDANDAAHG
jgi:hypothetical protein